MIGYFTIICIMFCLYFPWVVTVRTKAESINENNHFHFALLSIPSNVSTSWCTTRLCFQCTRLWQFASQSIWTRNSEVTSEVTNRGAEVWWIKSTQRLVSVIAASASWVHCKKKVSVAGWIFIYSLELGYEPCPGERKQTSRSLSGYGCRKIAGQGLLRDLILLG